MNWTSSSSFDHVTEQCAPGHAEVEPEVAAAELAGGLEAGMATTVCREALDPAELDAEVERVGHVADGQVTGEREVTDRPVDPRRTERHRGARGGVEQVGRPQVGVAVDVASVDRTEVDLHAERAVVDPRADDQVGADLTEEASHLGDAEVPDGEPDA
jgi:hypothetical protein